MDQRYASQGAATLRGRLLEDPSCASPASAKDLVEAHCRLLRRVGERLESVPEAEGHFVELVAFLLALPGGQKDDEKVLASPLESLMPWYPGPASRTQWIMTVARALQAHLERRDSSDARRPGVSIGPCLEAAGVSKLEARWLDPRIAEVRSDPGREIATLTPRTTALMIEESRELVEPPAAPAPVPIPVPGPTPDPVTSSGPVAKSVASEAPLPVASPTPAADPFHEFIHAGLNDDAWRALVDVIVGRFATGQPGLVREWFGPDSPRKPLLDGLEHLGLLPDLGRRIVELLKNQKRASMLVELVRLDPPEDVRVPAQTHLRQLVQQRLAKLNSRFGPPGDSKWWSQFSDSDNSVTQLCRPLVTLIPREDDPVSRKDFLDLLEKHHRSYLSGSLWRMSLSRRAETFP